MAIESLEELAASASQQFKQRYGRVPRWIVAAPGRVNLIGEHVDYNHGFVLPMAIERYCVIAAAERMPNAGGGSQGTFFSSAANQEAVISLDNPLRHSASGQWSNYVAGVIAGFAQRGVGLPGFQAVIESTVPLGGGLSSSAALEVAAATLIEAMTGEKIDSVEKALLCQTAEHEYAGVPCGIMDQFASVMCQAEHLMLLDCRSQQAEHIAFADPAITVLIINTNVKHELSGGEYAERRRQCESAARKLGVTSLRDAAFPQLRARQRFLDPVELSRARHVVSEIGRTVAAARAFRSENWGEVGRLMYASHGSLRDHYEVSCRELDLLVELARNLGPSGGVIGSRMTGGGFGGCTVSLVETLKAADVAEQLTTMYRQETGIEPSVIASRPAAGAHVVVGGGTI